MGHGARSVGRAAENRKASCSSAHVGGNWAGLICRAFHRLVQSAVDHKTARVGVCVFELWPVAAVLRWAGLMAVRIRGAVAGGAHCNNGVFSKGESQVHRETRVRNFSSISNVLPRSTALKTL